MLLALADANPNSRNARADYREEFWFSLPSEELMLCRSDGQLERSCVGEWWQFKRFDNGWLITKQAGWLCVYGGRA
jgi:hypothetical protein